MKQENQITQATERRDWMANLGKVVCFILRITMDEYSSRLYVAGLEYLKYYIKTDTVFRNQVAASMKFWAWWRNQWAIRDEQFVHSRQRGDKYSDHHEQYNWLHNPKVLSAQIHPNSVVLDDSYAKMIGEVMEEEVAK